MRLTTTCRWTAALAAWLTLAPAPLGSDFDLWEESRSDPAFRAPAFRTGQGLPPAGSRIRVEFRAVTADGTPVRDLRPEEVTLTLAGKTRTIASLEFFESDRGTRSGPRPTPAPHASGLDPAPVADLYLIVDEDSLTPDSLAHLHEAVDRLLERLAPADRVGLRSLRMGGTNIAPSANHDAVRAGLAGLTAGGMGACLTGSAFTNLVGLVRLRANQAPTAMALFSSGLDMFHRGPLARGAPSGACPIDDDDLAMLSEANRRAPVQMYFIQIGPRPASAGLEALARDTGATILHMTGDSRSAMARLARETAAYYVVSFEIEPRERDGSTGRLEVRVARDGVNVLARPEIRMPPSGRPVPALTPRDMVKTSAQYREFPLRAAAYPSSNYDGQVKLVVVYEPEDPSATMAAASLALFDPSNRLVVQSTARAEDLAGSPAIAAVVVRPGRYRLRVAATDASRRGATVDLEVNAQLTPAGPLTLSGLALGGPDLMAFAPRLQFSHEPTAVAYLEVYGVRPGTTLGVRFELASSPDGAVLETMPAMLPPSSTPGRIATAPLHLADLPPGDYIVRAIVSIDGETVGSTAATLRKKGKG